MARSWPAGVRWAWCLASLSLAANAALAQAPTDYSAVFNQLFPATVNMRVWAPDDVPHLRGVILSLPGHNLDSRGTVNNALWQQRCRELGFAFVGLDDDEQGYIGASGDEVRQNMQTLLSGAAAATGRPELANAPVFIFGISRGGIAGSMFAQYFADRTLGFYADKGASGAIPEFGALQRAVPGMMTAGSLDRDVPPSYVRDVFESWGANSQVSFAIEWGLGHVNSPDTLRVAYLTEVIEKRYPAGQLPSLAPNTPLVLPAIPYNDGWRGAANTVINVGGVDQVQPIVWPTIAPANQYSGPPPGSWLPTEGLARVYRAQNDRPVGLASNAFTFTANYSGQTPGSFVLSASLAGTAYSGIDLYDQDRLIAHLNYAPTVQQVQYHTDAPGLYTFVAVATYTYNVETHYTSKFAIIDTFGPSTSDYLGDYDRNRVTTGEDLAVWSANLGTRGFGVAGDGDGSSNVEGGDFLVWQRGFGTDLRSVQSVPEPCGAALALAALGRMRLSSRRGSALGAGRRRCW